MVKTPQGRVVRAVGTASISSTPGLAKAIEGAMSAAVLDAAEKGITDPDKVRALMMAAREHAKANFRAGKA